MINFDQNATTDVAPEVAEALIRATRDVWGNSSSGHSLGRQAGKVLDDCRQRVAAILGADKTSEVIFTSGGTESDNAAIQGIAWGVRKESDRHGIITSAIEHRAVLSPCDWLGEQGFDVHVNSVGNDGRVNMDEFRSKLNDKTALVSVMYANNEIGTIQPIQKITKAAHDVGAYVHTDAVQSAGKLALDVNELGVDSMSLSAHKFYGPKGVGVLYLRDKTPFRCCMLSGTHEHSMRAGTVAVPQVVALTTALELAERKRKEQGEKLRSLRDYLIKKIRGSIEGTHLNGDLDHCTLNTASIRFDGIYGGDLLLKMDEEGVLASAGSACMWERTKPSHVLTAIGLSDEEGGGTIRFSLGYGNTEEEVDRVAEILGRIVPLLRAQPVT